MGLNDKIMTIEQIKNLCIILNEMKALLKRNHLGKIGKVLLDKVEEARNIFKENGG